MELSLAAKVYFVYAVVLTSIISLSRSECTMIELFSRCRELPISDFLVTEIQSGETQMTVTCDMQSLSFDGWLLARDGINTDMTITSSSTKYEINGLSLLIRNISRTDEGRYTCYYQEGAGRIEKQCIYIVGKAVFASCQLDFNGCTESPTSLSVTEGESVNLNSTITFLPGGGCGIQQQLGEVKLVKINPESTLCTKPTNSDSIMCSDSRVSLDRGTRPGNEFIFTISNTVANYSGLYEAVVDVMNYDGRQKQQILRKRFNLSVIPASSSGGSVQPTTMQEPDITSPVNLIDPTIGAATTIFQKTGSGDDLLQPIIIAVAVALFIVAAVTLVIISALVYRCLRKQQQKKNERVANEILRIRQHRHNIANQELPVGNQEPPNANGIDHQAIPPPVYDRPPSNIENDFSLPHLNGDDEAVLEV